MKGKNKGINLVCEKIENKKVKINWSILKYSIKKKKKKKKKKTPHD